LKISSSTLKIQKHVAIIGSGPSALLLAATLDPENFQVTIYEKNQAPARKLLLAGQGGFNLTHSEPIDQFIKRYTPSAFFKKLITGFSNTDLQTWLHSIGIPTFTGTSKRVFPQKGIKPIAVLNAILSQLKEKNVQLITGYNWQGEELSAVENPAGSESPSAVITVFALGGSSRKTTGTDGSWTKHFIQKGITILPFQPSNCACQVQWPKNLLQTAEGQALKNISIKTLNTKKEGEVVITKFGLEGSAIYALSPDIRQQLLASPDSPSAQIHIDLKPSLSHAKLLQTLNAKPPSDNITHFLSSTLNLSKTHIALLKAFTNKEDFLNPEQLANKIKELPLTLTGMAPIDEAISTVGGIPLNEVDENFQLKKWPCHYAIGEMLDWDAPTGGYLLQACFSMGFMLADHLNKKYLTNTRMS